MIFETDVLIWTLRGNTRAARAIQRESERAMTVVNHMELMQGARDCRELALIKSFIKDLGFRVLPLSQRIGHRAAILMEEHTLSSGLPLAAVMTSHQACPPAGSIGRTRCRCE